MKEILDGEETFTENETREKDLLIAFVGLQHDYYLEKWQDKEKLFQKLNIAAFFLSFFWLLYRKMYLEVAIGILVLIAWGAFDIYVLGTILSVPVYNVYDRISSIVVGIMFGLGGNYLYLKSAQRKIKKLEMEDYSESELFEKVKKAGGTSILSVLIVCLATGLFVFLIIKLGYLD